MTPIINKEDFEERLRQELQKDFLLMIFLYIVMPIYY